MRSEETILPRNTLHIIPGTADRVERWHPVPFRGLAAHETGGGIKDVHVAPRPGEILGRQIFLAEFLSHPADAPIVVSELQSLGDGSAIDIGRDIAVSVVGIGTLISLFGAGAMTANTTAVSLNTAAIGGLIAALEFNTASNFIPFFANGGIVPHAANGYFVGGNSFSGDNTPIMANAGELVLSKSQQGVLASMLTDEERGGGNAQPYLDGEKIYLGLQAYMRRSGLGEIVTSER